MNDLYQNIPTPEVRADYIHQSALYDPNNKVANGYTDINPNNPENYQVYLNNKGLKNYEEGHFTAVHEGLHEADLESPLQKI